MKDELKLNTPIAFHPENCCGCTSFYYSIARQELIAECNECGMKRQFLLNSEGPAGGQTGGIIGSTVPYLTCSICKGSERKPKKKHCKLSMCVKKHERITCSPNGVQCEHYIPSEPCECVKDV